MHELVYVFSHAWTRLVFVHEAKKLISPMEAALLNLLYLTPLQELALAFGAIHYILNNSLLPRREFGSQSGV